MMLLGACAFAYLPTRLIQEANPEWRLVSWALGLEVVGVTLLWVHAIVGPRGLIGSAFSLCFFLVAVPWPTIIEAPFIQGLTRANTAATVQIVNFVGVPVVQHGNVIEVVSGMVGIDDACSGIRSFQATLMISLFFGELYRLTILRRVVCILAGFGLSFLFNVGRTTLLTWVAAHKGIAAIGGWHDPAGVTILVGCFVCLWFIALSARGKAQRAVTPVGAHSKASLDLASRRDPLSAPGAEDQGEVVPSQSSHQAHFAWRSAPVALLAWLLLVEGGTELWYRAHEAHLAPPVTWSIALPKDNTSLREIPLPEKARRLLRYDEALNASWQEPPNTRYQAVFLRWNPGATAVHLARSHTPEVCLTATGRDLVSKPENRIVVARGLKLHVQSYVFKEAAGPLHVYYCLWEDRAPFESFTTTSLSYKNRFEPVLAGRRHLGQRSLELALWGIPDDDAAQAAFERQLEKLIRL
jgi:exosortase